MPPATTILQFNSSLPPAAEAPDPLSVDSDLAVILASLLCALICVVGLALVARCAWLRHSAAGHPPAPPIKGLNKKALRALPKMSYSPEATAGGCLVECPICLAEFAKGDEIRILPQCGHGFHVNCADAWLSAHSSCPSCRCVLVVDTAAPTATFPSSRCQGCGERSGNGAAFPVAVASEEAAKAREDDLGNRFLP